jgi:hypothetical protein
MASWAGAYGAGGAADALKDIVARQFLERKQAEIERAQRVQEAQAQAELAQRAEQQRQMLALQHAELAGGRDERYQDRTQRVRELDMATQRQSVEDRIRAKERADASIDKTTEREDEQAFRAEERKGRQSFEQMMASRVGSGGAAASEPLVAIKDPQTGQPRLVPRSQAAGQTPASTRDQALTEGQSNAAGFADRMKFNEGVIQQFEGDATSRTTQAAGWLPTEMQPESLQQYASAKQNWIAATLRKESGAAISEGEYKAADRQYFPQPGEGPKTVAQKRELRALTQAAMRRASGSGAAAAGSAPAAPQGNDLGAEW